MTYPVDQELAPYLKKLKRTLQFNRWPNGASKILDFLYLGGQEEATNQEMLREIGITHVVNCASGYCYTGQEFYGEGVKYMGFDAEDEEGYEIMQHFDQVYHFIEDARQTGGKAFIHCLMGVNRSSALVVGYVMVHRNIGPISAATKVRQARGSILFNESFQIQVLGFARHKGLLLLDKLLLVLE